MRSCPQWFCSDVYPLLENLEDRLLLSAGDLTFLQSFTDGSGGVNGLGGGSNAIVSPDGRQVYVASVADNGLAVFDRASDTGKLTFNQALINGQTDASGNTISGLTGADCLIISPDGQYVYVGSATDDAIAIFSRDTGTGKLTFLSDLVNNADGVTGLDSVKWITLSGDGQDLYAVGSNGNSLAAFSRDGATGVLTFIQSLTDGTDNVDGLSTPWSIQVSPDGKDVYTAARGDNGIGIFSRDAATGLLTFVSLVQDGAGGVQNLATPSMAVVSADGRHLYAASYGDNAVVVFNRNADTGALTYSQSYVSGSNGINSLDGVQDIVLSGDGKSLYAAAATDNSVVNFAVDSSTGLLTFKQVATNGTASIAGLAGVSGLAIPADGHSLYAVGHLSNALAVFDRAFSMSIPIGAGAAAFITYTDNDGSTVTTRLTGGGTATVSVSGFDMTQKSESARDCHLRQSRGRRCHRPLRHNY